MNMNATNLNTTKTNDNNITYRPVCAESLSEKLLERAKAELNETEENIKSGLETMKKLIASEKIHLETDEVLLRFLRVKKYNFQASFESYKLYLRAISICVKQLKIPDFPRFEFAMNKNIGCVFPYRDSEDRAIILYRLGAYEKEGLTKEDSVSVLLGMCFFLARDPATQIGGIALVVDAKDMIYSDAPAIISYCRWIIPMLRGFPGRLRRVDIVNPSALFRTIINIVRPFIPAKIRNRIVMHGYDMDSLLRFYPNSLIPFEYGGTLGPMSNDHWKDYMRTCFYEFQNEVKTRYEK